MINAFENYIFFINDKGLYYCYVIYYTAKHIHTCIHTYAYINTRQHIRHVGASQNEDGL